MLNTFCEICLYVPFFLFSHHYSGIKNVCKLLASSTGLLTSHHLGGTSEALEEDSF